MKYTLKLITLVLSTLAVATVLRAGPTAAEVGDAESFGHASLYMGTASGVISLSPSCTPAPAPVPPANANNNQCFVIAPAPTTTTWSADDICRIFLPKKATRTIIYPALNFFQEYELENHTAVPIPDALFDYAATLSIESDVLLDPSIIDPATGSAANGKLIMQFSPNHFIDDRTMQPAERAKHRQDFARVGNAGINKAQMVRSGLPQSVVDDLFKSAMTIRMNVTGNARYLNSARITCNMRLFGD